MSRENDDADLRVSVRSLSGEIREDRLQRRGRRRLSPVSQSAVRATSFDFFFQSGRSVHSEHDGRRMFGLPRRRLRLSPLVIGTMRRLSGEAFRVE